MKIVKMLILCGVTACTLALTGCSDRSYDADAQRPAQESEQLRDRIQSQTDR
ncbi:MAG: hypothetical protein R3174_03455 [Gammaproteobacteria bacterium]|nr:hypothetical protein [Gammaproteobacteria bacterium]